MKLTHGPRFCLSVATAAYVVYMFRFFKTTLNLSHARWRSNYFKHECDTNHVPRNLVCPLGHDAAIGIAMFLICRHFLDTDQHYTLATVAVVTTVLVVSIAMNANVALYFLPVAFLEILLIK